MSTYTLSQREIPYDESWDVIVAGGGPAGCTAAAAAARAGARTLLIEATSILGGMGTNGLVPAWCPFTDKERIIYGGMGEKVLKTCMAGMPHVPPTRFDWTPIDPELLKRIYDDLVTGNGAKVLFNTQVTAVEKTADDSVSTIIAANKSGLSALRAKIYIDCTGDADLAAWAGAEFIKGDEDGEMQPATHCFMLANVDMYAYTHDWRPFKNSEKNGIIDRILADGKYPLIPDRHSCNNIVGPGVIGFNAGHLWEVDNTDPATVSKALIAGRRMAKQFRDALAEYWPEAFANSFLVETGSLMGIRETRRVIGDYILTEQDFAEKRSFTDEICRNNYFIDIHHKKKEIGTIMEGHGTALHMGKGESHGVPYRCLTPKGLRNVLVAGRSISTDRAVQGSTRVMPVCLCMGEAAGVAAAMAAADERQDIRAVDTDALRATLKQHGAYLPDVD